MRKIALVNQKGGVGKTTTAVHLAAGLAELGKKVLLIDLDPQANATLSFGLHHNPERPSAYSVLIGKTNVEETIQPLTEMLSILPSSIDLAGVDMELSNEIGRERVLSDKLDEISGFDFVLVDCPPSLGLISVNALTFVDEIHIPVQCEFFALHGLSLLMRTIDLVKRRLNPTLEISGVIACMYDGRRSLARETSSELDNFFQDKVFKTKIRTNVRLAEAPSHGKTVFEYAPDSYGSQDYRNLAREVAGLPLEQPTPVVEETAPTTPVPGNEPKSTENEVEEKPSVPDTIEIPVVESENEALPVTESNEETKIETEQKDPPPVTPVPGKEEEKVETENSGPNLPATVRPAVEL